MKMNFLIFTLLAIPSVTCGIMSADSIAAQAVALEPHPLKDPKLIIDDR